MTQIFKIVIEFKGIIKSNTELGSMAVIKHGLDARSSVQCMNVDEWDKYCQLVLDTPYHADCATIHRHIGKQTC